MFYSASGYWIHIKDKIAWEFAREEINTMLSKYGSTIYGYFIVTDSELKDLTVDDELMGKLIRKKGRLKIQEN